VAGRISRGVDTVEDALALARRTSARENPMRE